MPAIVFILLFLVPAALAQQPGPKKSANPPQRGSAEAVQSEQDELRRSLAEAGNSPLEFIRAIERHLEKYPETDEKSDLERAIVKAAIDQKDTARILLYGERVLAREKDDLQILERVTRALLAGDGADEAKKALGYARRMEELLRSIKQSDVNMPGARKARIEDDMERAIARTLALQARATGNLGQLDAAISLARKSYETAPNAESAREIARWLDRAGRPLEAVQHYADAFIIVDPRSSEEDRARDRRRMGELYVKAKGSETGLGDAILEAYDRTTALTADREARFRKMDPNSGVKDPMQFTISGLNGEKLDLGSLRGKVLVLDFWATWCGPCRVQYPLYEEVKKRFADRTDVMFLAISTDENRSAVKPFLDQNDWNKNVYFEDGLSSALKVGSIPTTMIVNRKGEIVSRMNGFVPERFVEMLTDRIRENLD
jgi:thiol-disulfide isomerase/thioredoxin